MTRPDDARPRLRDAAGLVLAVLLVYATALPLGFVWIDHAEIEEAGYRVETASDVSALLTMTLDQYLFRHDGPRASRGGYWRPVYALSISLDWELWGATPFLFHLENVLLHALVVVGLYLLGMVLARDRRIAFWAAALFAVHPLGISSVTWISGRREVLCAAFGVAALLALDRGIRKATRREAWPWLLLASLGTLGACLTKELGLVVPAAGVLLVLMRRPTVRVALAGLGGMLLVVLAVVLYRELALGGFGLAADYPSRSLGGNVATSATLLTWYAFRVVVPGSPLVSDAWPIATSWGPKELAAIGFLLLLAVLGLRGLLRRSPAAMGLAWAAIWILPTSGLVPLRHMHAERYLYPASWGLLLVVAVLAYRVQAKLRTPALRKLPVAVLALLVLWAGATTTRANRIWNDDRTLFEDSVARDPHHIEGRLGLAADALARGENERSIAEGLEALDRVGMPGRTGYWSPLIAHTNLGLAYYRSGMNAEALGQFRIARNTSPRSATAHYHVGLAEQALGRFASAVASFERSLELRPGDFLTVSNLASSHLQLGHVDTVVALLEGLVAARPDDRLNRMNLGSALLIEGNFEEALPHFTWLTKAPDTPSLAKLAWCQWELGLREAAGQSLERARALRPDHPTVRYVETLMTRRR